MFNPREYLETIRVVIEHRVMSNEICFALAVRNKQILCIPKSQVEKLDEVLLWMSTFLLQNGLTSAQWTLLERRIARLQKGGLLL